MRGFFTRIDDSDEPHFFAWKVRFLRLPRRDRWTVAREPQTRPARQIPHEWESWAVRQSASGGLQGVRWRRVPAEPAIERR